VLALTLASSIEGITRFLVPSKTLRGDADPTALNSLAAHIAAWKGEARLKDAAIDLVRRLDFISPNRALLDLANAGVGTKGQIGSWHKVRNSVMHGELVSRYSNEEDDRVLEDLADLLRALTREAARRATADKQPVGFA
jgi:hypothetical protein